MALLGLGGGIQYAHRALETYQQHVDCMQIVFGGYGFPSMACNKPHKPMRDVSFVVGLQGTAPSPSMHCNALSTVHFHTSQLISSIVYTICNNTHEVLAKNGGSVVLTQNHRMACG